MHIILIGNTLMDWMIGIVVFTILLTLISFACSFWDDFTHHSN